MTYDPAVRAVIIVGAYHAGPRLIVEVGVVMDPGSSLRRCHDISEDLQD
jgi:divalent metal cation (Fe/Co/Zn/Cd) transporter